jgi:diguanylate cyclase (GGDEF)-like protein
LCLEIGLFFAIHYLLHISIILSLVASLVVVQVMLLLCWKKISRSSSPKETELVKESDIDRLHVTPKKLQKQIYELHNLFEVSINLTSILDPEKLIESSMLSVIGQLRIDQIIMFLPSESDENNIYPMYSKGFSKEIWKDFFLPLKGPVIGKFDDKVIALDMLNIEEEFLDKRWRKLIDNGIIMIAPIISNNRIKGLIAVGQKINKEIFSQSEKELFSLLVHFISVAFSNSILYQEMEQISITDGLTGLYNYRFFKKRLEDEMLRSMRYHHSLSLVLIDVDFFKNYNDKLGHLAGDAALKAVAAILKSTIRQSDVAVRYGGEEFCVILPEENMNSAWEFAERLRKEIEAYHFDGEEVQPGGKLTVSLGVASYPEHADSSRRLIEMSDAALYKAKNMGRNKTYLISESKT